MNRNKDNEADEAAATVLLAHYVVGAILLALGLVFSWKLLIVGLACWKVAIVIYEGEK